jgi:hypothetical protein
LPDNTISLTAAAQHARACRMHRNEIESRLLCALMLFHEAAPTAAHGMRSGRMSDYPGLEWFKRYRERVNADQEMSVIGEWFTTTFALTFGDSRYALKVEKGRIADVTPSPRLDVRAIFGFRAPVGVWRKFLSPNPPPLFHDFFAMLMRVPEFTLEGDGLVAMQNARALHRMMNIMRETGAPHV